MSYNAAVKEISSREKLNILEALTFICSDSQMEIVRLFQNLAFSISHTECRSSGQFVLVLDVVKHILKKIQCKQQFRLE